MYQNQVNNLNRITAYYGYPANNKNSNTKNFDDSNNASLYSIRKAGDDTLNKSQSSPKSPNTSEILIQNIGGKVGDLSKEIVRLMQINDKLISDISSLNTQNQNKDFLIKELQERLNLVYNNSGSAGLVQNVNQKQIVVDYNSHQISNSKGQEKDEGILQQKNTNYSTLQPRSGISPNLYVNNMLNPNSNTQNVTNFDGKEDNQRYLLSSLQVNTDVAENTNNFLFNSGFSQSAKNSANIKQNSYEKINGQNQNQNQNITSPWSLYQQDDKNKQIDLISAPSFSNNNANNNNIGNFNNEVMNGQLNNINSQQNKMLMLASFQDKQSSSSEQANNYQSQFSLFQEELENVKREKVQLEMNYNDLKQKYEDQQKEHAREIAQLKTNMFNSVVESDSYNSKYDEDPLFNIENIKKTLDKNTSELIKSIEIDDKLIEGRFNKKENNNTFNNNSFSASKEQFMQKSNLSNKNHGVSDHQTNLVVSQEITSNKNLDKMGHSQQNIVLSNEFEKVEFKTEQFIKRNSLKQGTLNGIALHKENVHLADILEQLELAKKENTNLKYELKLVKEELLFISAKDTQAHSKNEQLRIIASKLKLEQEEEIMKYKIQNEELQSELKKLNSLNKNLQNEILKLKDGLQTHQRSSTIMDEKTLENLFDSEIESEGEDLEDDGYGDRDSKQIRKHKNDILNTMTNNEKIFNKIVYLKRKNRRLENQLEEWKRQYWLLEKSTQNNNYQSQNNNKNNNNKKANNNQNFPPQLIQQNSQGSNQEKSSLFEFNFSQFLQYQQRASQESKKQAQQTQIPQQINEIVETSEINQKENKLDSSTFSKNEPISQCDTPAIGVSVNQGRAEQVVQKNNYSTPQNEIINSKNNKNYLSDYANISNLIMNQQQSTQQEKTNIQQQAKQSELVNASPKSANINNKNNFSNEQFYKQTSFSNYNPYSLNSNYQIQKFDQYLYKPVTQFSPSQKSSDQTPNQNEQMNNQIHQIKEEKKQLEKGVISTIKDIRDQVNQLQKRKIKNPPQSQSHQQPQIVNQITKQTNKPSVQQIHSSSQKVFNDQLFQNKTLNTEQQKHYQSTSGLIHLEPKTTVSTTKISHLINNFKKLNLEKSQSPITQDHKSNNLNYTSINSNNTSQNIGNYTCQTDRQILYNNGSQTNVQSQPSLNHINQYQLNTQQKNLNKIAQTAQTTPKIHNAKHTTSVHQAQNNSQSQQYQQIKQVLHTQPSTTTNQEKNTFNNRQSANLSYETSKSQLNNLNKSTSPINSTKSYPKQIEQSYSNNFIYQKTKFNQRIKDKYN